MGALGMVMIGKGGWGGAVLSRKGAAPPLGVGPSATDGLARKSNDNWRRRQSLTARKLQPRHVCQETLRLIERCRCGVRTARSAVGRRCLTSKLEHSEAIPPQNGASIAGEVPLTENWSGHPLSLIDRSMGASLGGFLSIHVPVLFLLPVHDVTDDIKIG